MFFGERLYADFVNFTFPGTQYVYYSGFRIFGLRAWVPNATALVLGVVLAILTFAVANRVLPEKWACISAILAICFGYGALISPTHHFFCVMAVLAVLVLLPDRNSTLRWAAVGSAVAFAVWFSQLRGISVAIGIVIIILCGVADPDFAPWPVRFRSLSCYLGMLIATLAVLLASPLHHVGIARLLSCTFEFTFKHGRALRDNQFLYNFTWEGLSIQPGWWNLRHILEPLLTYILVPVICAMILIRFVRSNREYFRRHRLVFVIITVLLFSYASVLPSPSAARVAPDASLAFFGLVWYLREYARSFRIVVMAMLVIGLCGAAYRLRPGDVRYIDTPTGRVAAGPDAYDDLLWKTEHIGLGTYFLSTDYGDHFPIGARNPMPFAFLTNTSFTPTWQVEDTIRNLQEKDVRYIKWDARDLDVEPPDSAHGDNLGLLRNYIRRYYRPIFVKGGCEYFARIVDMQDGQVP